MVNGLEVVSLGCGIGLVSLKGDKGLEVVSLGVYGMAVSLKGLGMGRS